jgi:ABC-type phosphate/phosphonate transport system permease subunit
MYELNYTLIIVAAVAQFILGALWYSPLMFGKWWQEIMDMTHISMPELKKLQQAMMPFYGLQFVLTLVMTFIFAHVTNYTIQVEGEAIRSAYFYERVLDIFPLWIGLIVPTQISTVIWGNTKKKHWPKQLFVMLGMTFVGTMIAALILSM